MRTYYELEDYHWKIIKKSGLEKGKKVWVGLSDLLMHGAVEGIIEGFDIHIEGEIEVIIRLKRYIRDNEWDVIPRIYSMIPVRVFMYQVYETEGETLEYLEKHIKFQIKRMGDRTKYYLDELDKVRKRKEEINDENT